MARNVEIRERVGGIFNHADSLLYPKTHVSMVDGLLVNGKLDLGLLPDSLKTGLRRVGNLGGNTTLAYLLEDLDRVLTSLGLDEDSRGGSYYFVTNTLTLTVGIDHNILSSDDGTTGGGPAYVLETNDWIMYDSYDTVNSRHVWSIINNTHGVVTTSTNGLMLYSDKQKLDGIASNANNYSHPTYATINVDTDGVVVLDNFTSDAQGHVTGIGTRTLTNATSSNPGVMSAKDKNKLDGIDANANNYSLPTASASVLGGVKVGTGLSITTGVLSNALPNVTHFGEVTGDSALTITNDVVTNAKLADMVQNKIKGRATAGVGDPEDLTADQVRMILNVADGANNYTHPTQSGISLDLTSVETFDTLTVNTLGHVTAATKQSIRTGTTSQTGLLQLATGTELNTALSSTKALSPVSVKSMIDYFAGLNRYDSLTVANAATVAEGTIALVTVA